MPDGSKGGSVQGEVAESKDHLVKEFDSEGKCISI